MFWSYQASESENGFKEVWFSQVGSYKVKLTYLRSMEYEIIYSKNAFVLSKQNLLVNDLTLAKEVASKVLTIFVAERL